GLQTVILDEISAWAIIALLKKDALTISAKIDFLRPIYVEEQLEAVATIENVEMKNVYVTSVIQNTKGENCTKGSFVFRLVDREKIVEISKKRDSQ
ncbi:MAG: PaaI family thioesterase, partial [Candidatus Heimdallarchaeaceae archaeon]